LSDLTCAGLEQQQEKPRRGGEKTTLPNHNARQSGLTVRGIHPNSFRRECTHPSKANSENARANIVQETDFGTSTARCRNIHATIKTTEIEMNMLASSLSLCVKEATSCAQEQNKSPTG
jgi:hypothetical protein